MDALLADIPALATLAPALALASVLARLWWIDRRDLRAELLRERERNRALEDELDAQRRLRRTAEDGR